MAKRIRLTPAQPDYLAPERAPEPRAMGGPLALPPIAQVAGDAAATAALREVAGEMSAARAEGRLVQRLPLAAVEVDHLVRDRLESPDEEMQPLRESLRARGQQTPIEVVDLGLRPDGTARYGLISGWRRLQALQALFAETGAAQFATVQALLRRPENAAAAYLAMVEENEIRVGLSYYERARIATRAAELGVYASPQMALRGLFPQASRAKRSKIASFMTVHDALGDVLRFPTSIGERLGLTVAMAVQSDAGQAARLRALLGRSGAQTAAEEQALLARALAPARPVPDADTEDRPEGAVTLAEGIYLQVSGGGRPKYTLSGPRADAAFGAALVEWVKACG